MSAHGTSMPLPAAGRPPLAPARSERPVIEGELLSHSPPPRTRARAARVAPIPRVKFSELQFPSGRVPGHVAIDAYQANIGHQGAVGARHRIDLLV